MTSSGGLRLRHIPIVVHSAWQQPEQITAIDPTIRCVLKPDPIQDLTRAIDESVREYRERLLCDFHHVGLGITFLAGRISLVQCFAFPSGKRFETKYIDATSLGGAERAGKAYQRLILICDRHWSAELALRELEELLGHPKTTERDLHRFFQLHPEFLYKNCVAEHWAEPPIRDQNTGRLYKPDFVLKSVFLPHRPWSWQIVDLKRPQVPVIGDMQFHPALSQHVHKVVSQLRDYSEFFDNPANRDEVRRVFGGEIRKPKLVAVIGRLPKDGALAEYARLKAQILDVSILTYDEVLEFRRCQVDWRRSSNIL